MDAVDNVAVVSCGCFGASDSMVVELVGDETNVFL